MKSTTIKQIVKIEEIVDNGRQELKIMWRAKRFRSNETVTIPWKEYILLKTYFLEPYKTMFTKLSEQVDELKECYEEIEKDKYRREAKQ